MSGIKKILNNSGWMAGEQVLRLLSGLFIGVWIARHLGPSDYGALSFALSFTSLVGIFATLGLNRTVVRELTLSNHDLRFTCRIIGSVLVLRLLFAFLCYWIALGISIYARQGDPALVGIVAASIAFSSFDVVDQYFQSISSSKTSVIARSCVFFLFLTIKVALLLAKANVTAFALTTAIEAGINALALWTVLRMRGLKISMRDVDLRFSLGLLKESWPEIFAGFACLVFMRIDQIMIGNMIGEREVGVYSVASRLAEAWYFIPTALVASSFPAIVRQRELDKEIYLRRLKQLMSALVGLSYVVAILVTLMADWVIGILYGAAYTDSAYVLIILVWCGVMVSLGIASGSWIMAERKPILNLTRNVLGASANIGLNFFLIPRFGIIGAAFGTLASQSIAYFFSDFFNRETRGIGLLKLKSLLLIWK